MSRLVVAASVAASLAVGVSAARAERTYKVLIDSRPRGASVYIDTRDDGVAGETPYRTRLPAGTYTIIVEREGYATETREVEVRAWRKVQKIRFELAERVTGTLEVSVAGGDAADGAVVKVDGKQVGTAPGEFEVDVGPHVVEVVGADGDPFEEWIEVVAGETVSVEVELGAAGDDALDDDGGDDDDGDGDGDYEDDDYDDEDDGGGDDEDVARVRGDVTSAMIVVDTGLDLGGRHFSYSGVGPAENLRPYDADGVPLAHVGIEAYPLAGSGVAGLRLVGLVASLDRSLGLSSTTSDGVEVATTWSQWEVGARVRYALGSTLLGAGVAYGATAVLFEPAPGAPASLVDQVPEVDYRYLRIGGDLRYQEGRVGYVLGGSFLAVGSAGTSAARFRDSAHAGFGARAGFTVEVVPKVEARVMGRYDYFASSFLAETGDEYIADGAIDHIYGVLLGAAFVY